MAIALYARQSVERENSISCETQIEYCRAALKPDEQNEILLIYIDNGYSGGNVNRDGFQQMMQQIQSRKINKVIVYKLDRISRSLNDFVKILQEFKSNEVEFVSTQESFDTSSPYGELIVKILMIFAEFERTSIINRIRQAYAHRSELGFYMGGRRPYGFELVPTRIGNVNTKKLSPIPGEVEQLQYIFGVYAQENTSLRKLLNLLAEGNKKPLDNSHWTTAKLSTLLKNPIYVKADVDVYEYYENRSVQMVNDISHFTGIYGAQLYGHSKHDSAKKDWSDMKLVLLTHVGIIDSHVWLKCQEKLARNRQIGNSISNQTSWLAGKIVCEKCGHTMTTIKGNIKKNGDQRRYFICTGKSHKKCCTGTSVSIYADDLERLVKDCISYKIIEFENIKSPARIEDSIERNELKLKLKTIEKAEKQILDLILTGALNSDLLMLSNAKASELAKEKRTLQEHLSAINNRDSKIVNALELAKVWQNADYTLRKDVITLVIDKIRVSENGDITIIWNLF